MDIGTLTGSIELEDKLTAALNRINKAIEETGAASAQLQKSIQGVSVVGSFVGNILADVTQRAISFTSNIITGSLMAGARLEQLGVATRFMGEKAGYSGQFIDDLADKIQKTGISGISTRESILQLLGANISLEQAAKLSAIAQNMQSMSGKSSSEVFQTMTRAIATGNTELLRGVGFQNISIEGLKRQRKEQTGMTTVMDGATRTNMILNAVLQEGATFAGLYGESMQTAGKQASSSERAWAEVSEEIGTVLLPVTSLAIKTWYQLGSAVRDTVQDVGPKFNTFVKNIADELKGAIDWTKQFITTSVEVGIKVYNAYNALPDIVKKLGAAAALAAIGVWALNSALLAVTNAAIIRGLMSIAETLAIAATIGGRAGLAALFTHITSSLTPLLGGFTAFGTLVTKLAVFLVPFGAAVGAFLISPLGLALGAITLLVGGIRLLTGSWEFLLTPMRAVWQGVKDVWTILTDLASQVMDYVKPVLDDLATAIGGYWTMVWRELGGIIRDTRNEFELFWTLVKNTPIISGVIEGFSALHGYAEGIRQKQQAAEAATEAARRKGIWEGVGPLNTTGFGGPMAGPGTISGGKVSGETAAASEESKKYAEKVRDLVKSLTEGDAALRVFQDAFKKLTPAQLENYDVLKRVIPEIDKLAAAGIQLSAVQQKAIDSYNKEKVAILAKQVATLESAGVTLQSIEATKKAGLTEADIARKYGVTTEALAELIRMKTEAIEREKALASFSAAAVEEQLAAQRRKEALFREGNRQISEAQYELDDLIRQSTLSTTDFQIYKIREWEAETIAGFKGSKEQVQDYTDVVLSLGKKREQGLFVNEDAIKSFSKKNLEEIRDKAWNTYKIMAADPDQYSKQAIKAHKKIAEEASHAAAGTKSAWEKTYSALGNVANILDNISGTWAEVGSMLAKGAMAVMENLASGNYIGAAVAGITAVTGAIVKLVGASNEGRKAIKDFAASFDTLKPGSGFDELHQQMLRLGKAGEQMWIDLTQKTGRGDKEEAERKIKGIQAALASLDEDIQKYSLNWRDLADAQGAANEASVPLVESYNRLIEAGYTNSAVIRGMSKDLSQYVIDSIDAGTRIPAAMQPILEQLILSGQLTYEAAAAMLGLRDASMPSLADIKDAAERYGISLDSLGPKVKQLEITELANQYVLDWQILTAATDDWGVLFERMGPKVQSLITDAMRYGSELPAAMKPMIQAWIDQGKLVDENGQALTDLTKLTFAADLSAMFEDLILKLDELIEKIGTGVGGALSHVGRMVVRPRVIVDVETPESGGEVPGMAGGGIVYARGGTVLPFTPRGSDTVPAMLTPGERVLTVAENRAYENNQPSNEEVVDAVNSLSAEIRRTLPRALARAVSTGLVGVRTGG